MMRRLAPIGTRPIGTAVRVNRTSTLLNDVAKSSAISDHELDEEKSRDTGGPRHSLPAVRLVAPQGR
jgi:hypothetical protein